MKLKYVIGLLLLLNAAVLAWQWNAFARWGWGPDSHREPERVHQQIRPEALKFERVTRPAAEASGASTQTAATTDPSSAKPLTPLPAEGLATPASAAAASPSAVVGNPAGAAAPPAPSNTSR